MSDHSGFDLNNIDPMEIGRQLREVYDEYGVEASVTFTERLAAKLSISIIYADKDRGYTSEYIFTRIKAYIIYCGLLFEINKSDGEED